MNIHATVKSDQQNDITITPSQGEQNPTTTNSTKPEYSVVQVHLTGTSYPITCPSSETKALEAGAAYLSERMRDLRKEIKSKSPSNEELLVILCLELYDQNQELKHERKSHMLNNERAKALMDKITKDVHSVL